MMRIDLDGHNGEFLLLFLHSLSSLLASIMSINIFQPRIIGLHEQHLLSYQNRQKFEHYVWRLNRGSGRKVQYKVLYLGRHGEGYHNVAESYYGTPLWNVRAFPPA